MYPTSHLLGQKSWSSMRLHKNDATAQISKCDIPWSNAQTIIYGRRCETIISLIMRKKSYIIQLQTIISNNRIFKNCINSRTMSV